MARKKKKKRLIKNLFSGVSTDTVRGIWGIALFFIALFFVLASLGLAGIAGDTTYQGLTFLFGIGYFLLPAALFFISILFFRPVEYSYGTLKGIGTVVFVSSGLGLIDIMLPGKGGAIGHSIASPLIVLFDIYATVLILFAVALLSLVIMFDFKLVWLVIRGFRECCR